MQGYHGIVQSIIRRGWNAYQVTLGVYPAKNDQKSRFVPSVTEQDQFQVYRADIAIEGDRTILFPDRELNRCMDAFYESAEAGSQSEGLEREQMIGGIADRICRELRSILLEYRADKLA